MHASTQRLNEIIQKSGYKRQYIAEQLGITRHSLSNKITGRTEFVASEIRKLRTTLGLTEDETWQIFFAPYGDYKSPNKDRK